MREILVAFVLAASNATQADCGAISNLDNLVAWRHFDNRPKVARYHRTDSGGFRYSRRVHQTVRMAALTLRIGQGPKVRMACNLRMVVRMGLAE